jgi:hypothetical protein
MNVSRPRALALGGVAVLAILSVSQTAAAQACCGGTPQGGLPVVVRLPSGEAGTLTASVDWTLRQLDTPERTSGPSLAPLLDQRLTMQLYTAALELSVSSYLAVDAVAPVVVNHESVTLPQGTTLSGTAAGIGDVAIVGKLRVLASEGERLKPTVVVVAGLRAPTGPYTLASDSLGIFSPELQPGSGAWGGLVGISALEPLTSPLAARPVALYASATGSYAAANPLEYALGPSIVYALGAQVLLWHRLTVQAGVVGAAVAPDYLHGAAVDDTGSHQLWLAPTAAWTFLPNWNVYAGAQLPIWRSLNGTQLVDAYALMAGVLTSFSLWGG